MAKLARGENLMMGCSGQLIPKINSTEARRFNQIKTSPPINSRLTGKRDLIKFAKCDNLEQPRSQKVDLLLLYAFSPRKGL